METKVMAAGAIGAGLGVVQTGLLREYVDKKYPLTNIESLKGFGTPSALAGIGLGTLSLIVGAYGASKGKDGRQKLADIYVEPAIDYGATAFVSGIFSGWKPAVTEADCAAAATPTVPTYFYNGICHKTPPTGVTSMQGAPQVQTAAYRPPLSPSYNVQTPAVDMNVLRQMSVEIQRLANENNQLRVQAQGPAAPAITVLPLEPGTVLSKQTRYGFMGTETVPGQPTSRAREFGFMEEGRTPIAKVQAMRTKYDFMG